MLAGQRGERLTLSGDSKVILTYGHPEIAEAVSDQFKVVDVLEAYVPGKGCTGMNSILWGEVAALACKGHGLIDWGAISCVVENAGGAVSAWSGSAVPTAKDLETLRFDSILMAADAVTHQQISDLLAGL